MNSFKEIIRQTLFERYEMPNLAGTVQRIKKGGFRPALWVDVAGAISKNGVVLHGQETSASVLEENVNPQAGRQEVEMTTLDLEIPQLSSGPGEKLIKIDTQGYELEILKGAENVLKTSGVLILELNLIEIHKGVPLADEVIVWLKSRGFQMYDIAGLTRRPRDRALWQADFVFVPSDSPLRSSKSYD